MTLIDAIKQRTSIRNYQPETLTEPDEEFILDCFSKADSPFGNDFTMALSRYDSEEESIPSTYGFIKGARSFMLMSYPDDNAAALAAGYAMERIVLEATRKGLGTCWLAGTFNGSQFSRKINWDEDKKLKIVIPIGYAAEKRSLRERFMRIAVNSDKRKPMQSLFFENTFSTPLNQDSCYYFPLQMMRLAPSSTNSQPWRAIVIENTIHFYIKSRGMLSWIDCGIGLCHFDIALNTGQYFQASNAPTPPKGLTYVTSFHL